MGIVMSPHLVPIHLTDNLLLVSQLMQAAAVLKDAIVELARQRAVVDIRLRPSALVLSLRAIADAMQVLRAGAMPSGCAQGALGSVSDPLRARCHTPKMPSCNAGACAHAFTWPCARPAGTGLQFHCLFTKSIGMTQMSILQGPRCCT